jgi:hypothetical protein
MRVVEILELGGALRHQAERRCGSVNRAHLIVHEIMMGAFGDDPNLVATNALHGELSKRLSVKLDEDAVLRAWCEHSA